VENAKDETTLKRPLIEADLRVVFRNLVLEKPARGKLPRRSVDLAHHGRNLVIPELVDIVGTRIPKDKQHMPYRLYPWRLLSPDDDSRPVTVDPDVMSGRAVVTGTRIPITLLIGMKRSGKTLQQMAKTYNLPVDVVRKALLHIEKPLQKVA
jgi:uncharacterized protein (DUF433 family)